MSDSDPDITQDLDSDWFLTVLWGFSSLIASLALIVYEHIITMDLEVEHIWKRRINTAAALFVLLRYGILISISLEILFMTALWSHSALVYTFFTMRVWAIWGQHWLPLVILIPLAVAALMVLYPVAYQVEFLETLNLPPPYGGCLFQYPISEGLAVRLSDANSAFDIAFAVAVLLGTLIKTIGVKLESSRLGYRANIPTLLIRDGTFYLFDYVPQSTIVFAPWGVFILYLRRIEFRGNINQSGSFFSRFTSINFAGNIGAPLDFEQEQDMFDEADINTPPPIEEVDAQRFSENPLMIGLKADYVPVGNSEWSNLVIEHQKDEGANEECAHVSVEEPKQHPVYT
ncbi:hypothetical protein C8Q75DRAFT_737881 [Abortiporus biennis]|nr:hypothetical protein C8Q75DRAFT_737881 [Abortiporus biennis]